MQIFFQENVFETVVCHTAAILFLAPPSQRRHNLTHGRHGVSRITGNSLFIRQLVQTSNKKYQSSTLLALLEVNPPVTGGFTSQRAGSAESVSTS